MSNGDLFTGFIQQIPVALIIQVCLAGTLLVGAIVYFRYFRKRRGRPSSTDKANSAPMEDGLSNATAIMSDESFAASAVYPRIDTGQLPDLDMLVDSSLSDELSNAPASPLPPAAPPAAPPLVPDEPPQHVHETGMYTLNLHSGQTVTVTEVLTILRDANDNRLIIQMGDTAYRTLADTPELRKQFTQIMRELSETVTKPDTQETTPPQAEMPMPDVIPDTVPAEIPPKPLTVADVPDLRDLIDPPPPAVASPPPPPITPEGDMPGDLPSFRLDDHPVEVKKRGLLGRKKIEPAPVPELDIAASIEAYLQHKLKHTPEYAGRKIHVHSAPGGGVRIQVDEQFYDAVGDVDDLVIREFMAATIQEWQDRQ